MKVLESRARDDYFYDFGFLVRSGADYEEIFTIIKAVMEGDCIS